MCQTYHRNENLNDISTGVLSYFITTTLNCLNKYEWNTTSYEYLNSLQQKLQYVE